MEIDIEKTKESLFRGIDEFEMLVNSLQDYRIAANSIAALIRIIGDTDNPEIVEQATQELHEYVDNLRKARLAMIPDDKQNTKENDNPESLMNVAGENKSKPEWPQWPDWMFDRSGGIK